MKLKFALALILFTISSSLSAAIVDVRGYQLDTDTNVVTDSDGVEWLRWDQTVGLSANQALSSYGADGWTIASNEQMETFIENFFSDSSWPGTDTTKSFSWSFADYTAITDLHGETYQDSSLVIFGDDPDNNGLINQLVVLDLGFLGVGAGIDGNYYNYDSTHFATGVALVRSDVPIPSPMVLFLAGLVLHGFFYSRAVPNAK